MSGGQSEVQFVDELPARGGADSEFAYFFEALRSNPGRWAAMPGQRTRASSNVYANRLKKRGFDATTRGDVLYVRWPNL